MKAPVSDNVVYFFAKLGIDASGVDTPAELSIDRFDQWRNPQGEAAPVFTTITRAAPAAEAA